MTDKYTVSYSTISCLLRYVSSPRSPRTVNVYALGTSLKHLSSLPTLLMLESSLKSKNVTYRLHAACGYVHISQQAGQPCQCGYICMN